MATLVYAQAKIADQIVSRLNSVKPGHWTVEKTPQGFRVIESLKVGQYDDQFEPSSLSLEASAAAWAPVISATSVVEKMAIGLYDGPVPAPATPKPTVLENLAAKLVAAHALPTPKADEIALLMNIVSNGKQYVTTTDNSGKKWILSKFTLIAWANVGDGKIKIVVPKAYAKKKGLLL